MNLVLAYAAGIATLAVIELVVGLLLLFVARGGFRLK